MKIWETVYDFDAVGLDAFAKEHGLDLSTREFSDVEEAADFVCAELGLDNDEMKKIKAERKKRKASNPDQDELDTLVLRRQREHGGTYTDNMRTVLNDRPELKKSFTPAGR